MLDAARIINIYMNSYQQAEILLNERYLLNAIANKKVMNITSLNHKLYCGIINTWVGNRLTGYIYFKI